MGGQSNLYRRQILIFVMKKGSEMQLLHCCDDVGRNVDAIDATKSIHKHHTGYFISVK